MAEFDFASWVSRAYGFTVGLDGLPGVEVRSTIVAAPITESEMQAVKRALGASVPTSLRALFTRGAAAVDCLYVLEPEGQALVQLRAILPGETQIFGGAKLSPAPDLADDCGSVREWARETWIADYPDERSI
jgi:hypothetical protein